MSVKSMQNTLGDLEAYLANLEKAKKGGVKVGLPQEEASGKAYESGESVIEIGARHEFGEGVPRRSWLRNTFEVKGDEMQDLIAGKFEEVFEDGLDAGKALGQIGAIATNFVKEAFTTGGFGDWQDISETTKELKNSSQILIDSGTLRASISWVVET